VRYGLIWVFFGDPALANQRPMPAIPELDGDRPWVCVPLDSTWRAHSTMLVNNVMDSTHVATLHSRDIRTRSLIIRNLTDCVPKGTGSSCVTTWREMGAACFGTANDMKVNTQEACFE
jgi:phenylpropionate dioxygenase-like ring-hydroxylating dioxygenase large terminal subunit